MLARHPEVGYMPTEGQFLTDQLVLPRAVGLPRLWAIKPELFCLDENGGEDIDVERLKRQWGAHYNDPRRPVLLEKSPTNAGRSRWLQEHFEDAHFIGIVRNGYAVAEGIRRKAGHLIALAARQWARSNEIMLRDFDFLERKRLISYENLTETPGNVLEELYEFLGLEARSLECTPDRIWHIHEQVSPVRNMNEKSFFALTAEEKKLIKREAGHLLARLGYEG